MRAELKAAVCRAIDGQHEAVERIGREIFAAPELGFKEQRAARLVQEWFARLGFRTRTELGLTGVKATVDGGTAGPTVAILGELDSLLSSWEPAYAATAWVDGVVSTQRRSAGGCRERRSGRPSRRRNRHG